MELIFTIHMEASIAILFPESFSIGIVCAIVRSMSHNPFTPMFLLKYKQTR